MIINNTPKRPGYCLWYVQEALGYPHQYDTAREYYLYTNNWTNTPSYDGVRIYIGYYDWYNTERDNLGHVFLTDGYTWRDANRDYTREEWELYSPRHDGRTYYQLVKGFREDKMTEEQMNRLVQAITQSADNVANAIRSDLLAKLDIYSARIVKHIDKTIKENK